jgi:hypothetical protein
VEVLVATAAEGNKVLQSFFGVGCVRAVVDMQRTVIAVTEAAAIAVPPVNLWNYLGLVDG